MTAYELVQVAPCVVVSTVQTQPPVFEIFAVLPSWKVTIALLTTPEPGIVTEPVEHVQPVTIPGFKVKVLPEIDIV
jgi:hypothetical protein